MQSPQCPSPSVYSLPEFFHSLLAWSAPHLALLHFLAPPFQIAQTIVFSAFHLVDAETPFFLSPSGNSDDESMGAMHNNTSRPEITLFQRNLPAFVLIERKHRVNKSRTQSTPPHRKERNKGTRKREKERRKGLGHKNLSRSNQPLPIFF